MHMLTPHRGLLLCGLLLANDACSESFSGSDARLADLLQPADLRGHPDLARFDIPAADPPIRLRDGLIGYWTFDGDGADRSGWGRTMILGGEAGYGPGLFGQALAVGNTSSTHAIRPQDDGAYDFGGADFALQAWVYFADATTNQVIIEKFEGQIGPGWTLTKIGAQLQFYVNIGPASIAANTAPLLITQARWHHLLVQRRYHRLEVIYDGAVVSSVTINESIADTARPLLLGQRNSADGRNIQMKGRIDEVAIWERALLDEEVLALYNDSKGRQP